MSTGKATEAPPRPLLQTTVISRFNDAIWLPAGYLNEGAEILLMPVTPSVACGWAEKFGICQVCDGDRVLRDALGQPHLCPACRGETKDWLDSEVRLEVVRYTVRGWRKVTAEDPATGQVVELDYNEKYRDAVAEYPSAYQEVRRQARGLAGWERDRQAKAPSPPRRRNSRRAAS